MGHFAEELRAKHFRLEYRHSIAVMTLKESGRQRDTAEDVCMYQSSACTSLTLLKTG